MNKAGFEKHFRLYIMPVVQKQYPNDKPALRQAWNDTLDHYVRDGSINANRASRWGHPAYLR